MGPMRKPNIILINCDDLGYGDPGCYGSKMNKTPYLDRMAEEGLRFTDFYMASSVCTPSRGAMLTGCYPKRIDFAEFEGRKVLFPGQGKGLNPDEKTIASVLKDVGYATKLVGKWHCGDQPEFLPTRCGFDEYFGLPYSNDMGIQRGDAAGTRPPLPLMLDDAVLEEQPDQISITERYLEHSIRFIRENRDKPFFLYLAHMYVHLPHYPLSRFRDENPNPYAACVASLDWVTGVILYELKQQGLDEETIVIFTSDNGSRNDYGPSNGELKGTKFTNWEGGFRVPCIVRWPGKIRAGTVSHEIMTSLDFLPTLAALAGADLPHAEIDGMDISDHLLGLSEISGRSEFFYYDSTQLAAVRKGDWKLHLSREGRPVCELYNVRRDPGEATNLYDSQSQVVESFSEAVQRMRRELGDAITGEPGKACRRAGYVEDAVPLTHYDPEHPYYIAMYDLDDRG